MSLTRRQTLFAGAALPVAALAGLPRPALAQEAAPAMTMTHRDFTLGAFRVTTLLAGSRVSENPQEIFGLNVTPEEFAAVSEANFIPANLTRNYFTPTVVNTGSEVILFDTGLDPAGVTAALAAAGYAPDQITHVVITHMHGDHIGGLADDAGTATFPSAAYATGQVEFDFWAAQGNEGFEAKVRPLAEKFAFLADGAELRPGITGLAAFGHSPGHMVWRLESEGQSLLLTADTANHYVWSVGYPDWEVRFDADKPAAAATRRRILSLAATDRTPIIGYHMPFPGAGYIETRDSGFRFVPVSYQLG